MTTQRGSIEHSIHFLRFVLLLIFVPLMVGAQGGIDAVEDYYSLPNSGDQFIPAPGVLGNDSPGAAILEFDGQTSAGNPVVVGADGSVSLGSANGFTGDATFTYAVTDGQGGEETATVFITYDVPPPPPPPAVNAMDDYFPIPSNAVESWVGVLLNDTPGAVLVSADPFTSAGHTVTVNGDGTIHLSAANGFVGIATFTYTIAGSEGGQDSATVTLDYYAPPSVVDAVEDTYTLTNDSGMFIPAPGVLENDSPGVTVVAFDSQTTAGNYVSVSPDGSVQLSAAWGFTGTATFTYTVDDGQGQDTATVTLNYEWPADPVDAVEDEYYLPNNTSTDLPAPGLLANDSPGAWVVSSTIGSLFDGSGTVNADGSVHLPHPGGVLDTVVFGYIVEHPNGTQDSADVRLIYYDPNAVDAVDDTYYLRNNQSHDLPAPGLLENDTPGAWVIASDIDTLFDGSGYVNSDGSVYVPSPGGFVGEVSFTYTVTDAALAEDTATVTLNFEPSIVTQPDLYSAYAGMPLQNANVLSNDTGSGLWVISYEQAVPDLNVQADGTVEYTPPTGFTGSFSFEYQVVDDQGAMASGSATITVEAAPIGCAYQTQIPQDECEALVNLYNSTNGAGWTNNDGWLANNSPCSWYGVGCSGDHVWSLSLQGNNLKGEQLPTLPAQLFGLDLSENLLKGSIPALPVTLANLDLMHNQLEGPIPPLPPSMEFLDLSYNKLTGQIPELPGTMYYVMLWENDLEGPIPALPPGMQGFLAPGNNLTGPIPNLFEGLAVFSVSDNDLTGNIPPLPSTLVDFAVANNRLEGGIPELPAPLYLLWVEGNDLSGELPSSLASTAIDRASRLRICGGNDLYSSDAAVNAFVETWNPGWSPNNGCIANQAPSADAGADQVVEDTGNSGAETVTLDGSLSGDSDGTIASYLWSENGTAIASGVNPIVDLTVGTHVITLMVTDNRGRTAADSVTIEVHVSLVGCAYQTQIPQDECEALVNLYNSTNGPGWINKTGWLTTNTPCSWYGVGCDGGHVGGLVLPNNLLTGTIPELPARLQMLFVSSNRLSGRLPALPTTLRELDAASNQLTGPIPELPDSLVGIWLQVNQFDDSLPELPPNLTILFAYQSGLTGPLPELPDTLQSLVVFDNQLTGPLPELPPSRRQINVMNNRLSGPVPASIMSNPRSYDELRICGGANDLYSDDPAVNSFLGQAVPGWTANGNRCIPLPPSATPTHTHTWTPSPEPSATATYTHTWTPSPEPSATATYTHTWTPSPEPSATATYTHTWTPSPEPSATATYTHTWTPSPEPSATASYTPTYTHTPSPAPGNRPPTVAVADSSIRSIGRILAINGGEFGDPDGDVVTMSASFGEMVQIGRRAGFWLWVWNIPSSAPRNTPLTVTITARDSRGAITTANFTVTVR